ALLIGTVFCQRRFAGLLQIGGGEVVNGALRGRIGGCAGLQLQQVALGAVVSLGELAVSNTVLDQSRQMLHLDVFLAPDALAAPAGELIGGEAAGLLRLVQQGGGAIDVAVGERLGHFGRKQPLLEACDARSPAEAALKFASVSTASSTRPPLSASSKRAARTPATRCSPSCASPLTGSAAAAER